MSKVLQLLQEHQSLTKREIVELSDMQERAVNGILGSLIKKNIIERSVDGTGELVFRMVNLPVDNEPETFPDEILPATSAAHFTKSEIWNGLVPKVSSDIQPVAGLTENGEFCLVYPVSGTATIISASEADQILKTAAALQQCKSVQE